jgi:hypothetical protein
MGQSILFVMRHSGFVRNFERALEELLERGHRVHLAFERPREQADLADDLAARHAGLTWGPAPGRADRWASTATELRQAIDALRYRSRLYDGAPKLRRRGTRSMPRWLRWLTAPRPMRSEPAIRRLTAALQRAEAALPTDPGIDAYLAERRPDRVIVTPLVDGPTQSDWVQAARQRGIPAVLGVTSWDNLTNKGLIHNELDLVLVWNRGQVEEAAELHGVPRDRVVMTGAHSYDHWFTWRPSRTRAELCEQAGLPPERRLVLYLCSSWFIAPEEPQFVRRWLAALREGPAGVRDAAVLIRPHPANGDVWRDADLSAYGPASVWPPVGADPRTADSKADYFDSMYHCDAAVGINTSAIVELAIIGRPCLTVLDPEFRETQEGTLHFAHLTGAGGGAVQVAGDLAEHVGQLASALDGRGGRRSEAFVNAFVRPHGLEQPGAPHFAEAVEQVCVPSEAARTTPLDLLLRSLLAPLTLRRPAHERRRRARQRRKRLRGVLHRGRAGVGRLAGR